MKKRKTVQKCVIITHGHYAESLSKLFRRKGYSVQLLKDRKHFHLAIEQGIFDASVVLADRASLLGLESIDVISELKKKNPKADIFIIAEHGKISEFREASRKGLIEFFAGPRPPFSYLWSLIQRRKQRREDPVFQNFPHDDLKVAARAVSRGAEKFVFALPEKREEQLIEAVALDLWYRPVRHVICVSVQVGCPIGCRFCATGQVGFSRNLTVREILGQIWKILGKSTLGQKVLNEKRPFHITYMGEGEAMMNYDAVVEATRRLRKTFGERVSFTISTVGLLSGMRKLLKEGFGPWVTLQISLHAPTEGQRARLIPLPGNHLKEVINLARKYALQTGQRVCANYILIKRRNDSREEAERLAALLDPEHFYIKLSQLNPIEGTTFKPTSQKARRIFRRVLEEHGYKVKYFISRGREIGSGCGQMIGDLGLPDSEEVQ